MKFQTEKVSIESNHFAALLGSVAAILTVVTVLTEIVITFFPGGNVQPDSVKDWFVLLQNSPFLGLRNLGLLNIIIFSLGIPLYYSLYLVHQKTGKALAALAMILSFIATAVFLATNRAFSMLDLSSQYFLASTENQQLTIESAGSALLAVGRSHSPGTFIAFFFGNLAGILMSVVLLQGNIFGAKTSVMGLIGFSILLIFELYVLFTSSIVGIAIPLALIGGILNLLWLINIGIRFYKLQNIEDFL